VGAGGGTLYGLNENRRHDERYREAYAGCTRGARIHGLAEFPAGERAARE
jgi:hypothetical protein